MKKILFAIAVAGAALLALPAGAQPTKPTDVVLFYGQGCPHCASMKDYLDGLQQDYPEIVRHDYEVYFDRNNAALMKQYADTYGVTIQGVPTVFIGDRMITGYRPEAVKEALEHCREVDCDMQQVQSPEPADDVQPAPAPAPDEQPTSPPPETVGTIDPETGEATTDGYEDALDRGQEREKKSKQAGDGLPGGLTLGAVVGGAIVDAVNPCAFAVLILLMTTILATNRKRRALYAGLAFSASIFISYMLMGLGLFSAIQAAGVSRMFYIIIGILAILVGLFNLKDYFWYGRWFVMEVPLGWRPKLKSLIKGITSVPGAFLIGFAVSLFLLPCTSGPYIVILGLLSASATKPMAIALLLLYNAIFITPMLVITLIVSCGLITAEKAESWRQKRLRHLHLIAGIIMLLLGIVMLTQVGIHSL